MRKMPVGVMMSAGWTLDQLRQVRNLGFDNVQIHAPAEDVLADNRRSTGLIRDIHSEDVEITTVFAGFSGEDYGDIQTVRETVGYLNPSLREERIDITGRISDFANALGVDKVAAHIGFVPEDPDHPDHHAMVECVRRLADYCGPERTGLLSGNRSGDRFRAAPFSRNAESRQRRRKLRPGPI